MSVLKINTVQPKIEIAAAAAHEQSVKKPGTKQASVAIAEEVSQNKSSVTHNANLTISPIYLIRTRQFFKEMIPLVAGLLFIYVIWSLASHHIGGFPGPQSTWRTALEVFRHPFYDYTSTNIALSVDMGLGWHLINSLQNVLLGFIFAAIAGIPLGFMIGKYQFMSRMIGLIIGLFKPVSPLAWLPIGLLIFKTNHFAAVWVVFVSALWPIMINTAVGVSKVPLSYMNVSKMLNLSEWEIISKILFPYALPSIMNGLRLAIAIAWLVIVATEMLKSDSGMGFWILAAWKQSDYQRILIGILMIGIVGFMLESLLKRVSKRAFPNKN